MGPLLPALLGALLPLSGAASAACVDEWKQEVHQSTWEVSREGWAALCGQGLSAEQALAKAKAAFIAACLDYALPSIQAGYYHDGDAGALCAQGVPGRARIYKAADVPRPGPSREASGRITQALSAAQGLSGAVGERVRAGDLNAVYGERAGGGAGVVAGGGSPGGRAALAGGPAVAAEPARGSRLDGRPAPPPPDIGARRAADIRAIQERVVIDGVSKEAGLQARAVIGQMLRQADPVVVRNLADRGVAVYIIPKDKKLTDLEPFKGLKGTKTFDGRVWDNVRGVGNQDLPGGGHAMAVAEESLLLDHKPGQGYPKNYVLVHEFGHMVQIHGLPTQPAAAPAPQPGMAQRAWTALRAFAAGAGDPADPQARSRALELGRTAYAAAPLPSSFRETYQLYRASLKREGKSTLGAYADANEKEFFAELTAAYFDVGFEGGQYNDLRRLLKERPESAQLMYRIYGPAPSMRGR